MKTNFKIVLFLSVVFLLASCDKVGHDYLGTKNYHFEDNVKVVKETSYETKLRSKKIEKIKELDTYYYTFNEMGKITNYQIKSDNNPERYSYFYAQNGQISNIRSDAFVKYVPYFNSVGDLYKEEYHLTKGGRKIINYTYNDEGYVVLKTENIGRYQKFYSYQYGADGILQKAIMRDSIANTRIYYTYDNQGNILSEAHHSIKPQKLKKTYTYEYTYDKDGNWITRTKYEKKKPILLTDRTITYHQDASAMPTNVISSDLGSISFFYNYFSNLNYRLFGNFSMGKNPAGVLMIVLLSLSVVVCVIGLFFTRLKNLAFSSFWGSPSTIKNSNYQMKKVWMYNKEPYLKVLLILSVVLVSFIVSLAAIFLFGGLTWGFFWLIKILLLVLIFVGWVLLVGGVLVGLYGVLAEGGCGAIVGGIISALIGGTIVGAKESIRETGNRLVETGFEFMQTLNMFKWGVNLFSNYWDILLMVFVVPLLLFLSFAAVVILLDGILIGIEWVITKIYSIRRPCPICASTKAPYYLTPNTDKQHPVALRPGFYGTFTHKSPINGVKLPTMLLNGRWKLKRKCSNPNCKGTASAETVGDNKGLGYGTEIHIGVVGHRSSGKSYLLYSGLSLLTEIHADRLTQIDADNETIITAKKKRISAGDGIQTDVRAQYKAVQLIYKKKGRGIPYHLHFYDVAGEKFDDKSKSHLTAMEFYKNVQSIMFVVDPFMTDYTAFPADIDFVEWIESQNANGEKYKVDSTYTMLSEILGKAGHKSKKINFNFVCVKKDLHYFEAAGFDSNNLNENAVKQFLCMQMGLTNLVNSAKSEFKKVSFYAVSAISDEGSLNHLFTEVLKKQNVEI